jgi:hypothetical protein
MNLNQADAVKTQSLCFVLADDGMKNQNSAPEEGTRY